MKSPSAIPKIALAVIIGVITLIAEPTWNSSATPIVVDLGAAKDYVLLAGGAINTFGTLIETGTAGTLSGTTSPAGDGAALAAQASLLSAQSYLNGIPGSPDILAELGGQTYRPGVHDGPSAVNVATNMVLDGQGNYDSIFIFRIPGAFNVAAGVTISFINHAQPGNIYWVVTGAVALNANSSVPGIFIADGAIATYPNTQIFGALLSFAAISTLDQTVITHNILEVAPTPISTPTPTPSDTATVTPTPTPTASTVPLPLREPPIPAVACTSEITALAFDSNPGDDFGRLIWATTGSGRIQFVGEPDLYPRPLPYGVPNTSWDGFLTHLQNGKMYSVSVHFIADCGRLSERTILIMTCCCGNVSYKLLFIN